MDVIDVEDFTQFDISMSFGGICYCQVFCWIYLYFQLITFKLTYRQISYIKHTLIANKIVDHSDVVGASPVGTAPTTSSFST